jgi:hypothetical protein
MGAIDDAVADALIVADNDTGTSRNTGAIMSKIRLFAPPEIVQRLRAAIEVRVFRRENAGGVHDARWADAFKELQDYHRDHGHIKVQRRASLGRWLNTQRIKAKEGTLRGDRLERLLALGFLADPLAEAWEAGLAEYRLYRLENGHGRVPLDYVTASGYRLGKWVSAQRVTLRLQKLSEDRLARLIALGFIKHYYDDSWQQGYAELEKYLDENGHLNLPHKHVTANGFRLWQWTQRQRVLYRTGKLSTERSARLTELGLQMSPLVEEWERAFSVTAALVREQGHAAFARDIEACDGVRPWRFIQSMRNQYRDGTMAPERAARLLEAGIPMNAFADLFEKTIRALSKHIQDTGQDANLPRSFVAADGTRLGSWLQTQRRHYRRGRLDPQRAARLTELGVDLQRNGEVVRDQR